MKITVLRCVQHPHLLFPGLLCLKVEGLKGTEVLCLVPSSGNILAFQQQWGGAAKNKKLFVCFFKKGLAMVGHGLRSGQVPNSILNKLLITLPNAKE